MSADIENAKHYRALANKYHAFGFNVLPLGSDKGPVTVVYSNGSPGGYAWEKWKTTKQTEYLYTQMRSAAFWVDVRGVGGIAGPVSGDVVCFDFDDEQPVEVVLQFLAVLNLGTDYAWLVRSPGGWHVWVRCPGLTLPDDKGKLVYWGIQGGKTELRWVGHQTALPGSVHPSGKLYAWHNAEPTEPPAAVTPADLMAAYMAVTNGEVKKVQEVAPAPAVGVVHRNGTNGDGGNYAAKALENECAIVRATTKGGRNDQTNRSAFALGQLVGAGALDQSIAENALLDAAQASGLTEREALAAIRSGMTDGIKTPRVIPPSTSGNGYHAEAPFYEWGFVVDTPEPLDFAKVKAPKKKAIIIDGDDELPQTLPSERIESDLGEWGYTFSMCELDDTIEVNGRRIDDITAAKMRTDARDHGYGGKYGTPLTAMEDIVRVLAARSSYHPVRRYLDDLVWDKQDHFAALASHLRDKHTPIAYDESTREPVVKVFLWRWLLGAVAKAYTVEGAVKPQNPMLVLSGMQGLGKSTFASWLCPLPDLFIESSIDPDSGDHLRYLVTKWIWEVGELGATTRRSDREALKSFLTKQEATFRKPYDHHPVIKPSLASFIGTVNPMNTGFLDDPTGSRRFLVTELQSIDHSYIRTVDVHQVWAQVVATYRGDPQAWRLLPVEDEKRLSINSENEVERPYEGLLSHIFDIDPLRTDWWMPTHEIADAIKTYGDAIFDETRHHGVLGATLRGLGLERKQKMVGTDRLWGYYGISLRDTYKSIMAGPPP